MKLEDRLPEALARIADSTPIIDPEHFDPGVFTIHATTDSRPPSRRLFVGVAAVVALGVAGLVVVANRPDARGVADSPLAPVPAPETLPTQTTTAAALVPLAPGPSGALALPASTGLELDRIEQGNLSGGGAQLRWYSTPGARPEAAPYARVTSYRTGVPDGQSLGCLLAEEAVPVTLGDGTEACLATRDVGESYGRIMLDRSPFAVIVEGRLTGDELIAAANHVTPVEAGTGFEISDGGLPVGVEPSGTGRTVSDFAATGTDPTDQSLLIVNWSSDDGRSIFYLATDDDGSIMSNFRLGFETVSDTTVHGLPAFTRTLHDQPNYHGVVWHEEGVTYQVGSQQLTEAELLELVEQLRPATQDEWEAMLDAVPESDAVLDEPPAQTDPPVSTIAIEQ